MISPNSIREKCIKAMKFKMNNSSSIRSKVNFLLQILPNSKHYLLQFWAGLVGPVMALKEKAPRGVEQSVVDVTKLYVESRLRMAEEMAGEECDDDWDDPLVNEVLRDD